MRQWTGESVADGRYAIGNVVGRGRVARVHAAQDQVLRRRVAIKFLPSEADGSGPARWRVEAAALDRVDHRHVVRLYDGGETVDAAFLVVPLFPDSLPARLERGPMSRDETSAVVLALADALGHVHRAGFVHGDVDADGVLLDDAGEPCWSGLPGPAPAVDRLGTERSAAGVGVGVDRDLEALAVLAVRCVTGDRNRRTAPSVVVDLVRAAAGSPRDARLRQRLSGALESVERRDRPAVAAARRRARPGFAVALGLGFAVSVLAGLAVDVGSRPVVISGAPAPPGAVVGSETAPTSDIAASVEDALSRLGALAAAPSSGPEPVAADAAGDSDDRTDRDRSGDDTRHDDRPGPLTRTLDTLV